MCDENFEAVDDLSEGYRFILLPISDGLGTFDEDNEVVVLAFEMDACLVAVAVGHLDYC